MQHYNIHLLPFSIYVLKVARFFLSVFFHFAVERIDELLLPCHLRWSQSFRGKTKTKKNKHTHRVLGSRDSRRLAIVYFVLVSDIKTPKEKKKKKTTQSFSATRERPFLYLKRIKKKTHKNKYIYIVLLLLSPVHSPWYILCKAEKRRRI